MGQSATRPTVEAILFAAASAVVYRPMMLTVEPTVLLALRTTLLQVGSSCAEQHLVCLVAALAYGHMVQYWA